jgi:hypothetical protein
MAARLRAQPSDDQTPVKWLASVWFVMTVIVLTVGATVQHRDGGASLPGLSFALVAGLPGAMFLLRGVADAPWRARRPSYTRGTLPFLACYAVAATGLAAALVL